MWLEKKFSDLAKAEAFAHKKEQSGCLTVIVAVLNGYCVEWKPPKIVC